MKVKTYVRPLLSVSALLLYLAGQCCASGNDTKMTEKLPDEYSTKQRTISEAHESTANSDLAEQPSTIVAKVRDAAFDTTAKLKTSSFPVFSFDGDFDTRNESSEHCEKARRCSRNTNRRPYRCSCHSHCRLFGDCCEDAVHSNISKNIGRLPREAYSCYLSNSPFAKAVYIITSCPEHYEVKMVVQACDRSRHFSERDPSLDSLSTPVTDGSTGLTFGNLFCAICWDAKPATSEPWLWNFYCNNGKVDSETARTTAASFVEHRTFDSAEESGISTLTYLRTMCNYTFAPPRKFSAPFTECDPTEISTCPLSFDATNELVTLCRSAPTRLVYYNQVAYRNIYCLACNPVEDHSLSWSCLPPFQSRSLRRNLFTISVSPSSESCDVSARFSQLTNTTSDLCSRLAQCVIRDSQSIKYAGLCPSPIFNPTGKCQPPKATSLCTLKEALDDSSIACNYWWLFSNDPLIVQINSTASMYYSHVFESFENYTTVNGSFALAVNGSSKFFNNVMILVKEGILNAFISSPEVTTLSPMENDGTGCSSKTLHWGFPLTTLLISQCCLVVYFSLYVASQRLRCFMGQIVLNQSIAFFLGGTFFALRWIGDNSTTVCRPLLILVLYFYTAAFTWTSLFAIEVARAVSVVVSTAQPNRVNRRRVAYYVIGWGSSLILVLIGVIADELGIDVRPSYGTWLCWYGTFYGTYVYAAAPLALCLTIDMAAYVYVIVRLAVLEKQTRMARETRREKLWLSIKLLFVIGLQWAFVVAAAFVDADWVKCAFKVTGSLQGTFILLILGIKQDVIASLKCCPPPSENHVARQSSSSSAVSFQVTLELPEQAPVAVAD